MSSFAWGARTGRAFVRSKSGWVGVAGLIAITVLAVVGPVVWGGRAAAQLHILSADQGPSLNQLLGTDELGRDILARTLSATRLTVELGLGASAMTILVGFPSGALVAMMSPRAREVGRGLISALLSFPSLLLAIVVITIVGVGAKGAVIAVGIGSVPYAARISESLASSAVARDYVGSARVLGVGRWRLLTRYIIPNIAETVIITGLSAIAENIIDISALSFLGLGVQAPAYDWGALLTTGLQNIYLVPTGALGPAVMIGIAGLSLTLTAEALARAVNPALWVARPQRGLSFWRLGVGWRRRRADDFPSEEASVEVGRADRGDNARPVVRDSELAVASDSDAMGSDSELLLRVRNLRVTFPAASHELVPVRSVSMDVRRAEIVGIVGESGSGKSLTALAIAQLLPYPGRATADVLELDGTELQGQSDARLARFLGVRMALIFQNPLASLNPAMRVGAQLVDGALTHRRVSRSAATLEALAVLREVNIPSPESAVRRYPFEFSGGMRQRAVIAMGLMAEPDLIIADEPTTALDVTTQAQVLELLRRINVDHGTAILFISHNLAVVGEIAQRVLVMYAGRVVEDLPVSSLRKPRHPYTRALLAAVPSLMTNTQSDLSGIDGEPPDLGDVMTGCAFAPRCPLAVAQCTTTDPELREYGSGHRVACWVADDDRTPMEEHD